MVAGVLDPGKLVFVDECGTHTSLAPVYGYAPKGERLRLSVPRNRGKNTTLLASITLEAPSIGWQLLALDSSECDRKAFVSSLDTYGTRLLTEALSRILGSSTAPRSYAPNVGEGGLAEEVQGAGSCSTIKPCLTRRVLAPPTDPSFGSPWENQKDLGVPSGGSGPIITRSTSAPGRSVLTRR